MAILWQKRQGGNNYEIRTAGRTRRLYTNGICHTEYHPERAVTRSIWDLLFLPGLFRPPGTIRRVLLLGVAGGSVVRLLQRYLSPLRITGVELSSMHVYIARRFFHLDDEDIDLHVDEASAWLRAYTGPPFDMIIDDLFLEEGSEAVRAIDCDAGWFRLLLANLARAGVLSINFPDNAALRDCAWYDNRQIARRLPSGFVLRTPYLDNAVAAFMREPVATGELRKNLQAITALDQARQAGQLRYRLRRLHASA